MRRCRGAMHGPRAPRSRTARALLAALVAVGACDSPTIPGGTAAYDFRFLTDPPVVLRWPAGSTVRVFVMEGAGAERDALLRAAFQEGGVAWEEVLLFSEYRLALADRLDRADVALFWSDMPPPIDVSGCPPQLTAPGLTWSCPSTAQPGRLYRFPLQPPAGDGPGDVRMMVRILPSTAADPARVRRLVLHELGHVLGIGQHSPDQGDVMAAAAQAAALSEADRTTIQVLYHTQPDIVP